MDLTTLQQYLTWNCIRFFFTLYQLSEFYKCNGYTVYRYILYTVYIVLSINCNFGHTVFGVI